MTPADKVPDIPEPSDVTPSGDLSQATNEQIVELLGDVLKITKNVRADLVIENHKRDIRIRTNLVMITIALLVAVFGVGFGKSGINDAHQAKKAAERSSAALAKSLVNAQAARVANCENSNLHEHQQAMVEIQESHDQIDLFVSASPRQTDPARIMTFVKNYNRKHDAKINKSHNDLLRDCSPEGIRRFLTNTSTSVP